MKFHHPNKKNNGKKETTYFSTQIKLKLQKIMRKSRNDLYWTI
jgi:hypothetical protein